MKRELSQIIMGYGKVLWLFVKCWGMMYLKHAKLLGLEPF